jgi:hypothetical protein
MSRCHNDWTKAIRPFRWSIPLLSMSRLLSLDCIGSQRIVATRRRLFLLAPTAP